MREIPKHIAIIMDGNGRWAQTKGKSRVQGHREGARAATRIVESAVNLGVRYLTLYAFSTENWNRPEWEIKSILKLFASNLDRKTKAMIDNGVRFNTIGDMSGLPKAVKDRATHTIKVTADGNKMVLSVAANYGGRDEIRRSFLRIAEKFREEGRDIADLTEADIGNSLDTVGLPDPDLVIRTSGENRLSNFLLWQCAYAEFLFIEKCWPDFTGDDLAAAIAEYQRRERRFGTVEKEVDRDELADLGDMEGLEIGRK